MCPLNPCADYANDDTQYDADNPQLNRHPQTIDYSIGLYRVIQVNEITFRVDLREIVEILLESVNLTVGR